MSCIKIKVFLEILWIIMTINVLGGDEFYRYVNGERVEMFINREYITVKIDPSEFESWDNIYGAEAALDNEFPPEYLVDNIYRLRVSNTNETDNLILSLRNYDELAEINYGFKTDDGMDYYLGKYLQVKFKDDTARRIIDSIAAENELTFERESNLVPGLMTFTSETLRRPALNNVGNTIYEAGFADFAELSRIVKPVLHLVPNDTYYSSYQYWLNSDQTDFEEAYEYVLENDTILVAFLDSGMEPHEDFPADRIKYGWNYVPINGSSNYSLDDSCAPFNSSCYHGIAVVGIFGATINNSLGMAGAFNQTQIIMNKISQNSGWADDAKINDAFEDAADSGAVIISNSWGYNTCSWATNFTLLSKISAAVADGVVVIWASGNCDNPPPSCGSCCEVPAGHEDVIAVGATTRLGGRWEYSAYKFGEYELDVCAPGENMFSLDQMGDAGYGATKPCGDDPDYYCNFSGTSFAAPLVAGLAARIMARRPDYIGQPDTIKHIIYYSTGNG